VKLYAEEIHDSSYSLNIIRKAESRRMKWAQDVRGIGKKQMHTEFGEKSEEQRLLGRFRLGWKGNIKTNLKEIGWEEVGCIHLVQDVEK
jgi:hypothetical protein